MVRRYGIFIGEMKALLNENDRPRNITEEEKRKITSVLVSLNKGEVKVLELQTDQAYEALQKTLQTKLNVDEGFIDYAQHTSDMYELILKSLEEITGFKTADLFIPELDRKNIWKLGTPCGALDKILTEVLLGRPFSHKLWREAVIKMGKGRKYTSHAYETPYTPKDLMDWLNTNVRPFGTYRKLINISRGLAEAKEYTALQEGFNYIRENFPVEPIVEQVISQEK